MNQVIRLCLVTLLFFNFNQEFFAQKKQLQAKVIGKGKPVILLPGLTCSGEVWNETAEALKNDYELHLLTLPGFAGNAPFDKTDNNFLGKFQSLILDYIKKEKIKKPIIVGHSLGGVVALKIAVDFPKVPSKIVVVDAFPFMLGVRNPNMTQEQAKSYASQYKLNMVSNWNKSLEAKTKAQKDFLKFMITDAKKIDIATDWYLKSDIKTVVESMYELNVLDLRDQLDKIKVPALVLGSWIAGKPYGATREGSMQLYKQQYKKLKNLEIDMSDKGKHFIMWDDADFFNKKLLNFFK